MITYKGFGLDWKCRDMQYAVGETFTHAGPMSACNGGLHACEYPLDVFKYYPPGTSRFAEVEQSGKLSKHEDDSKVASSVLHVKAELSLAGIIEAAIDYTFRKASPVDPKSPASATGYQGAASATGDQGAASATGERGAASATGYQGAAMASGESGRVKGAVGNALFLLYRDPVLGEIKKTWSGIVGENGIEPDTWYALTADGTPKQVKK